MNRIKTLIIKVAQKYATSYILLRCYIGGLVLLFAGNLCDGEGCLSMLMRRSYLLGAYSLLAFGVTAFFLRLGYTLYIKLCSNDMGE